MADFSALFAAKTKKEESQHGTYKITWLRYNQLRRNTHQYCDGTDDEIRHLADMIAADGKVLQNLIVKKTGEKDIYEIIAGHKRCEAVRILVEEQGLEKYAMLPCAVADISDIKARFALISSNAHHEKTPYEIMVELQEMKHLLETYPEEFPDLKKGRMVEKLASQFGMAKSVVGDYQTIAKNLGDPGMELFKNGGIDKSAATALASLSPDAQKNLIDQGITKHKDIEKYKKSKNNDPAQEALNSFPAKETIKPFPKKENLSDKQMTEEQRLMIAGMNKLLQKFSRYSDDTEFTVAQIIETSNSVCAEILNTQEEMG